MNKVICGLGLMLAGLVGAVLSGGTANAQNPEFPGYLGVYIVEGYDGMEIIDFIPDTPAQGLADAGQIGVAHTIVRLAGKPTRTLQELRAARQLIPLDKEAKMVLRNEDGETYHVWISRNQEVLGSTFLGSSGPATGPKKGAPDQFRAGGKGTGGEGDFRPKSK